jgi:hypothetical protein
MLSITISNKQVDQTVNNVRISNPETYAFEESFFAMNLTVASY